MGGQVRDKELAEYRKRIGQEKYRRQYTILYNEAMNKKSRFSGLKYENSPEKLKQIREKYKNGVSKEIINEWINNL